MVCPKVWRRVPLLCLLTGLAHEYTHCGGMGGSSLTEFDILVSSENVHEAGIVCDSLLCMLSIC